MDCPKCGVKLDESAATCVGCGQSALFTVRAPDGAAYGPYTLGEIRAYAAQGRIVPSAVLISFGGETVTLAQAEIAAAVPYVSTDPYATEPPYPAVPPSRRFRAVPWGLIVLIVAAVLIPILAIMSAILVPVFLRAGQKAKQASCLANVKQLSTGLRMYSQKHGVLPDESTWRADVQPYTYNLPIMECPASGLGQQSYDMTPALSGVDPETILTPADTVLIYDAELAGGTTGPHAGGGSVGFADGHAKWLTAQRFAQLQTPSSTTP